MPVPSIADVTQLLSAWNDGDSNALDQLIPLVDHELRCLANIYMRSERPGQLLQASDLVNEAYIRLTDWKKVHWQNCAHFFGVAAQVMRHVLVENARACGCQKRGGGARRVEFDEASFACNDRGGDIIALDDALRSLAAFDWRKSQVVELRFFGGLSEEEVAEALKVSTRTVRREWVLARAWLRRELRHA